MSKEIERRADMKVMAYQIQEMHELLMGNGKKGLCERLEIVEKENIRNKAYAGGIAFAVSVAWAFVTHFFRGGK